MCVFILITHFVSEAVIDYTKKQIKQRVTLPVRDGVIHPIYNIIDETQSDLGLGVVYARRVGEFDLTKN
jgi:hypothetical protein